MEKKTSYVVKSSNAQKLPIDPTVNDPFYRYQMHQLQVQVIGNGKMIRTAFLNVDEVAKDLKVPPDYLPNFMAQRIGCKAWFDASKPERERGSISGEYPLEELTDHLERFILKFVLCPECRLPEISYVPLKKNVGLKCRSCGWKGLVGDLDIDAKFEKYVVNHPPPKTEALDKAKAQREKAAKKQAKADAKLLKAAEQLDVDHVNDDDVEWMTDTSAEAAAKRAADMVPEKMKAMILTGEAEEGAAAQNGSAVDKKPAVVLQEFIASATRSDAEIIAEIERLRDERSLKPKKVTNLLHDGLFPELDGILPLLKQRHAVLAKFLANDGKQQLAYLNHLDFLAAKCKDEAVMATFLKKLKVILKVLYEKDVLEEEQILHWGREGANDADDVGKKLREASEPFLKWLEEASEES